MSAMVLASILAIQANLVSKLAAKAVGYGLLVSIVEIQRFICSQA